MAKTNPEVILLRGDIFLKEREAAGTIKPGHLIQIGSGDTVVVHAVSGGNAMKLFAVEGDIVGDDIDHTYLTGENVRFHAARSGDEIYAFLADGESVTRGDFLESDGNGAFKSLSTDSIGSTEVVSAIVQAMETLDLSASSVTSEARLRVMVQ